MGRTWSRGIAHALACVLLASLSCDAPEGPTAPPTGPGPSDGPTSTPGATDAWIAEAQARIRDASHAFLPDGDGFRAEVPERGLAARFDAEGAHLTIDEDDIGVRTMGFGRETRERARPVPPTMGSCTSGMFEPSGDCVRRLEYTHEGLTEWWSAGPEGLQQGFEVQDPPAGHGPLVVDVGVDGADVTVDEDALWIQGDAGGLLIVSGLAAWDADGVPLDARFDGGDGGFRIRVDDDGARYPIGIDPVYTTAAWTAYGSWADEWLGSSVSRAGDVNGDGYDDLIVSALGYDSYTGRVYVYLGSASGASSTASMTYTGTAAYAEFGSSVSGAGDVNGDGYDDVIVGQSGYVPSGRAYVYHASASGPSASASATLTGEASASAFGRSVSDAGDVNGDGYDDVIVGADAYSSNTGRAYVFTGSASGLSTTASTTLTGAATSNNFGFSVSGAGDVDGDGYDDVVVGAYAYSSNTGRAYVYAGSASGVSASPSTTLTGAGTGYYFGYSVSGAGDVDGDGYDDIVVGAIGYSFYRGRAYVHHGSASGVATTAATTLTGASSSDYFGWSVSDAGNVDGNAYDDVIVGAMGSSSDVGWAYVYEGSASGIPTTASTTLTGTGSSSRFGASVSGGGDLNGDGYDDVVVGAYAYVSYDGRVTTYAGGASGSSSTASTTIDAEPPTGNFGISVSSAGDVDADGYSDVIVGAPEYDSSTGRAFLFAGSPSGPSAMATATLTGESTNDFFGSSVSGAGDVNGDGYDDVIVGAPRAYRSYVFPGSATGLSTSPSTTLVDSNFDDFGVSVSGAGDVNGDGYDDVIVGASEYVTNTGAAYVYHGSASGVATSVAATLTGEATSSYFGRSVSGGDVDGDGYDDVVVGAYGYRTRTGRAYVFTGSAGGVSTTAATTLDGAATFDDFGWSVASADVDGDGYDDVLVGARYADTVYVFAGSAAGTSSTASTTLSAPSINSDFGASVSGAGDVDGDGYEDVIVGANRTSSYQGRAYVYHGSAAGLSTSASTTLTGTASSDDFGYSVSGAGDVDGDGHHDVIVGAYGYDSDIGAATLYRGYADADADGVASTTDCDDGDATVGAATVRYADGDGDGYGTSATATVCTSVPGYADATGDCDDTSAAINPGATEVCDTSDTDEDCDGLADDDDPSATGQSTFYADADGDGTGGTTSVSMCEIPSGHVSAAGDCDDTDAAIHPGATEVCDPADTDEDCDGLADDASATGLTTSYVDADGDGYGTSATADVCPGTAGYTDVDGDCDDTVATTNPGGTEVCDPADADEDCDGLADDASASGQTALYVDADGDGYGSSGAMVCADTPGYATIDGDCDDTSGTIHPSASEVCDAADTDEDCDGLADDASATGQVTYYADADGDGYGGDISGTFCDPPSGYVADTTDCDDADADVHPAATEIDGDGTDGDCDGTEICYADADGDGYRSDDGTTVASSDADCDDTGEALGTTPGGDCDDASTDVHPGAVEDDCTDPADYNCDGSTGYADADADGHAACQDCDDTSAAVNPDATEVCNGVDDDCDGSTDEDATDALTWYADADGDGATDPTSTTTACDAPQGYAAAAEDDCDDADAARFPGADDVPGDGIDQDCDGADAALVRDDKQRACGCGSSTGAGAPWVLVIAASALMAPRRHRRS